MLIKKTDNPRVQLRVGNGVLLFGIAMLLMGISLPQSFAGNTADFVRGLALGVSIMCNFMGLFLMMRARKQLK